MFMYQNRVLKQYFFLYIQKSLNLTTKLNLKDESLSIGQYFILVVSAGTTIVGLDSKTARYRELHSIQCARRRLSFFLCSTTSRQQNGKQSWHALFFSSECKTETVPARMQR